MNYIDIFVFGLVFYGAIKGFTKGIIVELASILALFVGVLGAFLFSNVVKGFLSNFLTEEQIPSEGILFIFVFIFIVLVTSFLAKMITKLLKLVALGLLNRVLGALFGGGKFILILSVLFLLIDQVSFLFSFLDENVIEQSISYEPIKNIGSTVFSWILENKKQLPQIVMNN